MKKLLLFFCILSISIGYSKAEVVTGECGSLLKFSLNTETGVLTITGWGAMSSSCPWSQYKRYIKTIQLPEGLTTIGREAFDTCYALTSVTIPNSVTTIGERAFRGCSSLTSVNIPNSVSTIRNEAFSGCFSLISVTIPSSIRGGVEGIWAFAGVPNIVYSGTDMNAPWGARSMNGYVDGYLVYRDATKKELLACSAQAIEITIPNSVTTIRRSAFSNCSSLTSVTIPNGVTTIGDYTFYNCSSLTSVTIPSSITTIGEKAFYYCTSLTSVTIPNGVTTIGDEAFNECSKLTSIIIPNSVTTIGKSAFYNCSSLTSVTIGNSVKTIGESAFNSCSSLTSITCEATYPPTIGDYTFGDVPKEAVLYVHLISIDLYNNANNGWGYFKDIRYKNKIYEGICGENLQFSLNAENRVLSIKGHGAMYDYKYASDRAPWNGGKSYIKSIQLPTGLTTIGDYAFYYCTSLTSVTIPNSVTTIGNNAFSGWRSLISVTIPNSVTTIGASAFSSCTELIEINCEATTPPTIKATTFEGVSKDYAVLRVPSNNINLYRQAGGWKEFYDIRPIEANTQAGANVAVPAVTDNGATVEWKYVPDANTYTLEIKQNGKVIITLVFNESGQLLSINFNSGSSAPARKMPSTPRFANSSTNGWQYTINGLEPNTTYTYTVTAKKDEKVLETKSIEFTTTDSGIGTETAVENVVDSSVEGTKKILHNGQIYIITPDGKKYSPTGAEVK